MGLVLSKTSINPGEGSRRELHGEAVVTADGAGDGGDNRVTSGTDLSLNTSSLTFTTSNWGTAQTVTVSAGEDADAVDDDGDASAHGLRVATTRARRRTCR